MWSSQLRSTYLGCLWYADVDAWWPHRCEGVLDVKVYPQKMMSSMCGSSRSPPCVLKSPRHVPRLEYFYLFEHWIFPCRPRSENTWQEDLAREHTMSQQQVSAKKQQGTSRLHKLARYNADRESRTASSILQLQGNTPSHRPKDRRRRTRNRRAQVSASQPPLLKIHVGVPPLLFLDPNISLERQPLQTLLHRHEAKLIKSMLRRHHETQRSYCLPYNPLFCLCFPHELLRRSTAPPRATVPKMKAC